MPFVQHNPYALYDDELSRPPPQPEEPDYEVFRATLSATQDTSWTWGEIAISILVGAIIAGVFVEYCGGVRRICDEFKKFNRLYIRGNLMLGRILDKWTTNKQRKEILEFIEGLSAMDGHELGLLVACANDTRLKILGRDGYNLGDPVGLIAREPFFTFHLVKQVHRMQRQGKTVESSQLMVWVHTLRASENIKIRNHGRAMWQQLSRGFPHVATAAQDFQQMTGVSLDTNGFDSFPLGLTPEPL